MSARVAIALAVATLAAACVDPDGADLALGEHAEALTSLPGGGPTGLASSSRPTLFRAADWRLQVIGTHPQGWLAWDVEAEPGRWAAPNPTQVGANPLFASRYTAIQQRDGKTRVLAAVNGYLYQSVQTAPYARTWTPWFAIAPALARTPSVTRNRDGRLEAVFVGVDGRIKQLWEVGSTGAWSAPHDTGVVSSNPPVIARDAADRLEIFVPMSANGCGVMYWRQRAPNGNQGWFPPALAGGPCTANLAVAYAGVATEVFAEAIPAGIYRFSRAGSDLLFQVAAMPSGLGPPALVRKDDDRILAFAFFTLCITPYACGWYTSAERTATGWVGFSLFEQYPDPAPPAVAADAWVNRTTLFIAAIGTNRLERIVVQ